jgi:hypothetical protein
MFGRALVRRVLPNVVIFFLLWPLGTAVSATIDVKSQSATSRLPWVQTFLMLVRAEAIIASDLFFVALLLTVLSLLIFSALSRSSGPEAVAPATSWIWLEPILLSIAIFAGIALEYPAVLANPFLLSLRSVSIGIAMAIVAGLALSIALLLGVRAGGARGAWQWTIAMATVTAVSWMIGRAPVRSGSRQAPAGSVVLLGIDSLSQSDDLGKLRAFTIDRGGTWYDHAVTPGLLTNAVWGALLQHRLVRETGVWEIFMTADWSKVPYDLVREAHRQGFTTYSYFSDQFTTYVGTEAGFDVNRSGPMGWLQLATASLKNDSVFLPVALPRLPSLPGAKTPSNQSGTFGFDVAGEIETILTTNAPGGRAFSAGHLDYLHQPLYPKLSDLTAEEKRIVLHSPVVSAQDFSFDWQYPPIPGDALGLYRWKIRHVQDVVSQAIERTRYLDPARKNRLVLFSDHGNRKNLNEDDFANPSYWNVVCATFGIPSRESSAPISLLEIPGMLGFPDPSRPGDAAPAVQFAGINEQESAQLSQAYFLLDGRIIANPKVMAGIGKRIKEYRPFQSPGIYLPAPAQ